MSPLLVPDPPSDLPSKAAEATWTASAPLFRCHDGRFNGWSFNPGVGNGSRFNWFPDASGTPVPILYAGASEDCALLETVFHNVPARGGVRTLLGRKLLNRQVSEIAVAADLRLVEIHDPGLLRLDLRPRNLTDTNSCHYPRTVRWAQALHEQISWAQGLVWMSARFNTHKALVLFGDRVPDGVLSGSGFMRRLDDTDGVLHVKSLGDRCGVMVTWPSGVPTP